jgi:hypothetical protein
VPEKKAHDILTFEGTVAQAHFIPFRHNKDHKLDLVSIDYSFSLDIRRNCAPSGSAYREILHKK